MKTPFATVFVWVLLSLFVLADDELVSVDAKAEIITAQQKNGPLKSYHFGHFTDVTINGAKGTVEQLRPGMQVSFALSDAQTVSKVVARGNPKGAETSGSSPTAAANAAPTRRIVVKMRVAGQDNVVIQNGRLFIEHVSWANPKEISINDVAWKPEWNDKKSEDFTGFVPPLAPLTGSTVTVKQLKGRGEVKVLEPPTETNGQKLVVCFRVTSSGPKEFEARISW
jgi:hypothetical protein